MKFRTRTCGCGKEFEGKKAKYCEECRKEIRREGLKKFYEERKKAVENGGIYRNRGRRSQKIC